MNQTTRTTTRTISTTRVTAAAVWETAKVRGISEQEAVGVVAGLPAGVNYVYAHPFGASSNKDLGQWFDVRVFEVVQEEANDWEL